MLFDFKGELKKVLKIKWKKIADNDILVKNEYSSHALVKVVYGENRND